MGVVECSETMVNTAKIDKTEKPKVVVMGAGIGGLTLAHELAKKDFDVTVYERNDIVGGLARSRYHKEPDSGETYPVEYSWRVYGTHYNNLLRILGEIPRSEKTGTVFDSLVKVYSFVFARFDKEEVVVAHGKNVKKLIESFVTGDRTKILSKVFYSITMSTQRMDSMENVKWKDFCDDLSPEAQKFMVRMWGPVLGMDPSHMSFSVIARILQVILGGFLGATGSLYLLNKPTSDGWFDEWTEHLKKNGVKIKTGHEIQDIKLNGGLIKNIAVKNKATGEITNDIADYYVCAMSTEAIADIVTKNQQLSKSKTLANIVLLAEKSRQIQLSVQIFLDQKLKYPVEDDLVVYLPDTPWAIIIEPEAKVWRQTYSTDEKVKTILSVGICQTDAPGIVFNKAFTKCNKQEIREEVWQQIIKSYRMSNIKTESGETIDHANIELFYMWDSFQFNQEKREIEVWEPKFSNNANTLEYQPSHETEIPNLLFATGYTKTARYIYSMESAAEAGTRAANAIIKKNNLDKGADDSLTKVHEFYTSPLILRPLALIDRAMFKLGLPHPSVITFNNSLALVVVYLLVTLAIFSGLVIGIIALIFR